MKKYWWLLFFMFLAFWGILAHSQSAIVLTVENPACTTGNPCTLQMYRATCTDSTGGSMGTIRCPNYPDPGFILLQNTVNTINGVIQSTGTKWTYTDKNGDTSRPALVPAQMYGYAATAMYNGDTSRTPSNGSATLSIPFQVNIQNAPLYPVTGTCRIVK